MEEEKNMYRLVGTTRNVEVITRSGSMVQIRFKNNVYQWIPASDLRMPIAQGSEWLQPFMDDAPAKEKWQSFKGELKRCLSTILPTLRKVTEKNFIKVIVAIASIWTIYHLTH